jgi:hypothetical protein
MEFPPFQTQANFTPEQIEIRNWIKLNKKTLEDRSPNEVAALAIKCGFSVADVCMTLADFCDAMAGTSVDNRAAFQSWLLDRAIQQFAKLKHDLETPKELDLSHQWRELVANTVTGQAEAA